MFVSFLIYIVLSQHTTDENVTSNEQKLTTNEQKQTTSEQKAMTKEQNLTSNEQKQTSNKQGAKDSTSSSFYESKQKLGRLINRE